MSAQTVKVSPMARYRVIATHSSPSLCFIGEIKVTEVEPGRFVAQGHGKSRAYDASRDAIRALFPGTFDEPCKIEVHKIDPAEAEPKPKASIYLRFLLANGRWVFTFGDALLRMHTADGYFFEKRLDAVAAANRCGLQVSKAGRVTIAK